MVDRIFENHAAINHPHHTCGQTLCTECSTCQRYIAFKELLELAKKCVNPDVTEKTQEEELFELEQWLRENRVTID